MTKPLEDSELRWIGVDFDKTLAHSSGFPDFEIKEPLEGAIEAMEELHRRGWKITIFTARPWSDYQKVEDWCIEHKLPTRRIICGKPLFKYLIDDRNIEFNGDWTSVLNKVGYRGGVDNSLADDSKVV